MAVNERQNTLWSALLNNRMVVLRDHSATSQVQVDFEGVAVLAFIRRDLEQWPKYI